MPFTSDWIPIYPQGIKCPDCGGQELSYRVFEEEIDPFDSGVPEKRHKMQCANCGAEYWVDVNS